MAAECGSASVTVESKLGQSQPHWCMVAEPLVVVVELNMGMRQGLSREAVSILSGSI